MIKTSEEIEADVFRLVKRSALANAILGGVYRDGKRPNNSNNEDIIVIFQTAIQDDYKQIGAVNINVYVPDNRCREEYCLHFKKRVVSTINRAVIIPEVDGVIVSPNPGIHYTPSMKDFKFSVKYPSTPLKVTTDRVINGREEVLVGHLNSSGEYEYVIPRVTQNINLKFAPDNVSTAFVEKTAVWSYGREIRIRANKEDVASIYSVAGKLVKRIVIPQGNTTVIPMERGVYMVALKDGSMHKVIVK